MLNTSWFFNNVKFGHCVYNTSPWRVSPWSLNKKSIWPFRGSWPLFQLWTARLRTNKLNLLDFYLKDFQAGVSWRLESTAAALYWVPFERQLPKPDDNGERSWVLISLCPDLSKISRYLAPIPWRTAPVITWPLKYLVKKTTIDTFFEFWEGPKSKCVLTNFF